MPVDCRQYVAQEQRANIVEVNPAHALIVGLALITLPYWYTPIFAISIR